MKIRKTHDGTHEKNGNQKGNQKGFSLVEVLVSIALLAILSIAITGFMNTVNRNYKRNQTEVELQYESQMVMNQLKDLMIDTTKGIATDVVSTNQTDIYIFDDTFYYRVTWIKDKHSLYLKTYSSTTDAESPFNESTADLITDKLMEFDIDLSAAGSRRQVQFTMVFAKSETATQKFESSNTLTLRNNVAVGKTRQQVYP